MTGRGCTRTSPPVEDLRRQATARVVVERVFASRSPKEPSKPSNSHLGSLKHSLFSLSLYLVGVAAKKVGLLGEEGGKIQRQIEGGGGRRGGGGGFEVVEEENNRS